MECACFGSVATQTFPVVTTTTGSMENHSCEGCLLYVNTTRIISRLRSSRQTKRVRRILLYTGLTFIGQFNILYQQARCKYWWSSWRAMVMINRSHSIEGFACSRSSYKIPVWNSQQIPLNLKTQLTWPVVYTYTSWIVSIHIHWKPTKLRSTCWETVEIRNSCTSSDTN